MTLVAPVILVRPMNLAALGVLLIPVRSVTLGSSGDPSVPRASGGLVTLVTPLSPVALVAQVILLSPVDLVTLTALADLSGSDGLGDPGGLNGPAELPGPYEPYDPHDPGVHGAPAPHVWSLGRIPAVLRGRVQPRQRGQGPSALASGGQEEAPAEEADDAVQDRGLDRAGRRWVPWPCVPSPSHPRR